MNQLFETIGWASGEIRDFEVWVERVLHSKLKFQVVDRGTRSI